MACFAARTFTLRCSSEGPDRSPVGGWDDYARRLAWSIELQSDPHGLGLRFLDEVSEPTRRYFAHDLDLRRRPFPLEVIVPDEPWTCEACGAHNSADTASAVRVAGREANPHGRTTGSNYSDLGNVEQLIYCATCITMASEAVDAARQQIGETG